MDAVAIGTIIGLVLGAVTLIGCFVKGKFGLGLLGAVATLGGGIVLGLFGAAPVCGYFLWRAFRQENLPASTLNGSS